jgi:L-alanine-DL-glutamate epimerase-like enolase superfamily enzyme
METNLPVEGIDVHAFTLPTDGPGGVECDGTMQWSSTTMVLVQVHAGRWTGTGYTYGDRSVAAFVESLLVPVVAGAAVAAPAQVWQRMYEAIRNAGQPGVGSMAIAAVDLALWDLKARMRELPLTGILPSFHEEVPVYGSGGFTNYPDDRLAAQLRSWVEAGIPRVKIKTSRCPEADPGRLSVARKEIGDDVELFTDSNGALSRKQALAWAQRFAGEWNVSWMEEPVTSDDPEGLRLLRDHGPAGLDIAAGEYGYRLRDFTTLLDAGAVDCLQADLTRCGGITGLLQVAGLCAARKLDLSAHCAPALSAHAFCAVPTLRHLEYFHDHVRFESLAFDGTLAPSGGALRPDRSLPGNGLEVRWQDLEQYRVHGAQPA